MIKARAIHYYPEHYACWSLSLLAILLLSVYMYLIFASVIHVVIQKEMKQSFTNLHSEIASLETEYISIQHAVSADLAIQRGFVENAEKIFISRQESAVALSNTD